MLPALSVSENCDLAQQQQQQHQLYYIKQI